MFYNTGLTTYIWLLSNKKPSERKSKIQLIDATDICIKRTKSLGKKANEFSDENIHKITEIYLNAVNSEQLIVNSCVPVLKELFGTDIHLDFNLVKKRFDEYLKEKELKLKDKEKKDILEFFTTKNPQAQPIINDKKFDLKKYKPEKFWQDYSLFTIHYSLFIADTDLRDTENVPLKENITTYFNREVIPHATDAWIDETKTVKGYEINFSRYFYKSKPLRTLDEIRSDILALDKETEGLLELIILKGEKSNPLCNKNLNPRIRGV